MLFYILFWTIFLIVLVIFVTLIRREWLRGFRCPKCRRWKFYSGYVSSTYLSSGRRYKQIEKMHVYRDKRGRVVEKLHLISIPITFNEYSREFHCSKCNCVWQRAVKEDSEAKEA